MHIQHQTPQPGRSGIRQLQTTASVYSGYPEQLQFKKQEVVNLEREEDFIGRRRKTLSLSVFTSSPLAFHMPSGNTNSVPDSILSADSDLCRYSTSGIAAGEQM